MDNEEFADSGILDIVRDLQGVDVDTTGPSVDRDTQDGEEIKLTN